MSAFYLTTDVLENVFYPYLSFSEIYWFETLYKIERRKSNKKLWLSLIEDSLKLVFGHLYHELLDQLWSTNAVISGPWIFQLLQVKLKGHREWSAGEINLRCLLQNSSEVRCFLRSKGTEVLVGGYYKYLFNNQLIDLMFVRVKTVFEVIDLFEPDLYKFAVYCEEKGKLSLRSTDLGRNQLLYPETPIMYFGNEKECQEASEDKIMKLFSRGVKIVPSPSIWSNFEKEREKTIYLHGHNTTLMIENGLNHSKFWIMTIQFEPFELNSKKRKRSALLEEFVSDMKKLGLGCKPQNQCVVSQFDENTVIFKLCVECTFSKIGDSIDEKCRNEERQNMSCCLLSLRERNTKRMHYHICRRDRDYTLFFDCVDCVDSVDI